MTEGAAHNQTHGPQKGAVLAGRYLLVEPVGEGGMAVVWRAVDQHLKRDVALKLLHPHVLPSDRRRFEREIRALASLSHPNIIGIQDLGEHDGQLFFTMELLLGGPISSLGPLEDNSEELEQFLQTATQVAFGLEHIHAQGIIHRDLTPHNILLDESHNARIMDFGLIYMSEATRDLTRAGYTLGTPAYMAPEQARGLPVSNATDVYSLGAVLYRTIAGRPPFEADGDQGVLYQHVHETPTIPDQHNASVPNAIAKAVMQLLEKPLSCRPSNAKHALGAALQDLRQMHYPNQYRAGRARTGHTPDGPTQPETLALQWEEQLPGETAWPVAIGANAGLLALGHRAGGLTLLESNWGARLAELPAKDEITAPATFNGPNLAYGSWDGHVRLVDWRTGVLQWQHQTRAEITAAPTKVASLWLVPSRDGHLHAINAQGQLVWAHRLAGPVAATPTLWGGLVILGDEEGWLHALEPNTGSLAWKVQLQAIHATCPAAKHPNNPAQAVVVVPTWSGEVHALSLERHDGRLVPNNEPLWSYDLEGECWASPAIADGRVLLASWANELRCLHLASGDDAWVLKLEGRLTASPVVSRGVVYAASEAGELVAVRLSDGAVLWRDTLTSGVQCTPLVTQGGLVVATLEGRLRLYR